jgi:Cu+-exporting ATPase
MSMLAGEGMARGRGHSFPVPVRLSELIDFAEADLKGDIAMAKDPVCGMAVDEKKAAATAVHQGKTYYFCAVACKEKFMKNPQQYLGGKKG